MINQYFKAIKTNNNYSFPLPFNILLRNYIKYKLVLAVLILVTITGCFKKPAVITILNPSGLINTTVYTDSMGRLTYSVQYNGKTIVATSPLGITIDQQNLGEGVAIGAPIFSLIAEKYPCKGVHAIAVNHYQEAIIPITHLKSGIHYQLQIKAFDDGIAFRYVVPKKGIATVDGEASSWQIPRGSTVWYQENILYYEGLYYSTALSGLGSKRIGPPLTYQTSDSIYVSISEAALYNYSGMSLQSDSSGMLHAAFVNDSQGWKIKDTIVTPWRVAIVSSDLNGLVNADIIQNLNPAPDTSLLNANWIKPGRAVWSYFMHENVTTMSLEKKYIDKAAMLGFEYNMVDAGWETSWPNCMDSLKSLVEYAQKKKVQIWVWKSYTSLKDVIIRQIFFKHMRSIGVAGIKIDFIDKEGIEQVKFYEAALKDAAFNHLMLNFHGANKPTGYNRTYPNELTREAIYGQEWTTYNPQGPIHNTITPFTRFLAGPADATPGVFDSKKAYGTSRAHQLALQIIFNSVLTCWPADPDLYLNSTALPLIKSVPTVWDETIVLAPSSIGKLAAFARRKGSDWYIGVNNAGDEKQLTLSLKFLGPGNFNADIFQDDLTNPDHLLYSHTVHTSNDSLLVVLRQAGGFAAMLKRSVGTDTGLTISPKGGYLYAPILVNMETNSGFQIRYTTDGKDPTAQAPLFTNPFTIVNPALIRATAFSNGKPTESTGTAQFIFAPAPVLSSPAGLFINNKTIRIGTEKQNEAIHYTLDGSEPTTSSLLYKDSLVLTKTVILKVKTFFKSGLGTVSAIARYIRKKPATAVINLKIVPGLMANFFEGTWQQMPDFNKLTSGKISVVSMPDLKLAPTKKEYYAIQFSGYIKIPVTGVYSFYALSDDGSLLFIDDEKVVDNNGCHGDLEKSGDKALAAGLHKFRLHYFQNGSGQTLQVYMKGPEMEKQIITPAVLFH